MDKRYRDKDWLRDKYWNEELSTTDIADLCGCSHGTIYRWMKRYSIPRRDGNIIKPDFSNLETLSYILGVLDSDGSIYLSRGNGFIALNVVDKEFADSFYDSLESIGLHPSQYIKKLSKENHKDQYRVTAISIEFYRWHTSLNDTEKQEIVEQYPRGYLRGFYEGDGTQNSRNIRFVNTDLDLIELVESLLDGLGFRYSRYIQKHENDNRNDLYTINILGGSSERNRFLDEIDPVIRNKKYNI